MAHHDRHSIGEEVNKVTEKRSMKDRGEDAAAAYLERVGIRVIERTRRTVAGVIDSVAFDGDKLVVFYRKTRRSCRQAGNQQLKLRVGCHLKARSLAHRPG